MRKSLLFIIAATIFLWSCSKQLDDVPMPDLSPEQSQVICTIFTIDSTLEDAYKNTPCSKVPCNAIVIIDSVIENGRTFGVPLSKGAKLAVKFEFTTAPTDEDLFPNKTNRYPGVTTNSQIITNVEKISQRNSEENKYKIYWYRILTK